MANKLNDTVLDAFKYYFLGKLDQFRPIQLNTKVLAFLLCSNRVFHSEFDEMMYQIFATGSRYIVNGIIHQDGTESGRIQKECRSYKSNATTMLVWLNHLYLCGKDGERRILLDTYSATFTDPRSIIKAIYLCQKLNINVYLNPVFRNRLITQLLADVPVLSDDYTKVLPTQYGGGFDCNHWEESLHYGVGPVPFNNSFKKALVLNDYTTEEIDQLGYFELITEQYNHNFLETKDLYMFDWLNRPDLKIVSMLAYNFLGLLDYCPLPKLPNLQNITAGYKLFYINPTVMKSYFSRLLKELYLSTNDCSLVLIKKMTIRMMKYDRELIDQVFRTAYAMYEAAVESDIVVKALHCEIAVIVPLRTLQDTNWKPTPHPNTRIEDYGPDLNVWYHKSDFFQLSCEIFDDDDVIEQLDGKAFEIRE
ncbi:unnamed protein product [Bursaphelenchus okinawaensis]|uniref:Uncharacterized protein n=1 Tax=Bursaphelenchus okinawaensis TaxID=465554 RepID=A0A811JW58_9BILA|nr:unnamed protein product [Bursaphelenchus okinawaensis]CAG9085735.1 unnamed protein product [Bursaphelenchus okinawaensis]